MGKEPVRRRERREAYFKIQNGGAFPRARLGPEQMATMFAAVDKRDMTAFGVRTLVNLDLDQLGTPPPSAHLSTSEAVALMEAPTLTLLSYAAWRRRPRGRPSTRCGRA